MNDINLTPDLKQAEQHLTLLDETAERFTFQTFADTPQAKAEDDANRKAKRPLKYARVYHGTLEEHAADLQWMNAIGAGVFVTAQETDLTGRKTENITRIRAVFQEDDGEGKQLPLEPNFIIESSPGKYHRYMLSDGAPLDEFEAVQRRVVDDYGSDPNAKDRARVLRLAGFYHRKDPNKPHLVRVYGESGLPPYKWQTVKEHLPPVINDRKQSADPVSGAIIDGARNSTLTSIAGTMRRRGLNADEIAPALHAINQKRCAPPLSDSEVAGIVASVAKYAPQEALGASQAAQNSTDEGQQPGGAFDLAKASVGDLLDTPPPPRRFLVADRIPCDTVGLWAAAGGTGKGFTTLQLAVSVATGLPWLGMPIEEQGSVLMVSAEDNREEMHRRLYRVAEHYRDLVSCPFDESSEKWEAIRQHIKERLFIVDRVGEDNRLTGKVHGELHFTPMADRIIETAQQANNCKLIILDPLSRFDGGDPNDNSDGTRLIETAEYIRRETGATVLLPHHVAKGSMKDANAGQEAVRGASGLVDGARFVVLLQTMRAEMAKDYGIDPDNAGRYVYFSTPKQNYSAPWPGLWLERQQGGVLIPSEMRPAKTEAKERKADAEYGELVRRIIDLLKRKGAMPKRRIEDDYGGTTNILKAGQKKVRDTIHRALDEGHLVTTTDPESKTDCIGVPQGNLAAIGAMV